MSEEKKILNTQETTCVQEEIPVKILKSEISEVKEHTLKISNFTLKFGDNVLFENFEYEFKPGIYLFKGPSGVGKSTLMRVIAGLERRFTGKIELDGKELRGFTPGVHMMHQHYTSFPWLNLLDNTLMVHKGHKVKPTSEDIAEAMKVLERLGLKEHIKKRPSQISGGQDQRLSLASAYINRWSPVILYDEPTSALDQLNDELVVEMILERQAKYGTIEIVITHEDHVAEGLNGTVLDFTPEFRLRKPAKSKKTKTVPVLKADATQEGNIPEKIYEILEVAEESATDGQVEGTLIFNKGNVTLNNTNNKITNGVPDSAKNVEDTK